MICLLLWTGRKEEDVDCTPLRREGLCALPGSAGFPGLLEVSGLLLARWQSLAWVGALCNMSA